MALILIIDDNETNGEMLSLALSLGGHQARTAQSGKQGAEMVTEAPPDLILLDLMMPDMDGLETLRRIRDLPAGRELPVIVVTATASQDLKQQIAAAGGNAYLTKPVDLRALLDQIHALTLRVDATTGAPLNEIA